jgi:putative tributyrin esterase
MAIAQINYFNKALVKEVGFCALLPDRQEKPGPYPVVYMLHGLSDDYTAWLRWTSIERYAWGMPAIVVLVDSDRCWYSNIPDGPPYEDAIIKDLIPFVDSYFPTVASREGRALGGLSMGGFGAIKLALKFPEMFCSAVGHSGAYDVVRRKEYNPKLTVEDCPFALAEKLDKSQAPALRLDCGTEDVLLDHNRAMDEHLTKLGIAHEYDEFPGAHEWGYWDQHIQEALAFHCKAFGIA